MKYNVQTQVDDEYVVIGEADTKYGARKVILEYAKTLVGDGHVAAMTYDLCFNSTVSALVGERVTHIREDWEGNWVLVWFNTPRLNDIDGGTELSKVKVEIKDKFFFVFENDDTQQGGEHED